VFGKPLSGLNATAGYLFQADAIMPWRTALQNVAAGLEIRGVGEKERQRAAKDWLRRLGSWARRMPTRISCRAVCGGELRWRRC
jgi:NitT/TauT family transport system ATP-binding protein